MNKRALMLSAATVALLSGPALADTDISNKVDTPINTATDGNITIESDGSVVITANPAATPAVTINSNGIVDNQGLISYKGVANATGVELETGNTGEYEQAQGATLDLSGAGAGKTAILISGPSSDTAQGTFTGVIPSGGTSPVAINLEAGSVVKVQGDNSYGIDELYGTNIVGDIDIAGSLTVTPTSTSSTKTSLGNVIAINLAGTMTGNLDIQTGGVVAATGQGAEGIQLLGNLTGSIINDGAIETYGTTGSNSNPNNTNLPQAGTALGIGASVSGGIYNSGPSTTSDTTTSRSIISTIGNAPAVLINPTIGNANPSTPLVIGIYNDPTDPGYSFLNRGTISGASADADSSVTTFSIVGASQTAETILTGGLFNGGSITASATTNSKASTVSANALFVGDYTDVPTLNNSNESNGGSISASISGPEAGTATAITIEQYGTLNTLINSGTISASASTTNPQFVTSLTAYGIFDASGTLNLIDNSGTISATATQLADNGQVAIAIDLAVSQQNVTINNTGKIIGSVYLGTGNDTVSISGSAQLPASMTGNLFFGGTGGVNNATPGDDSLTIGDFGSFSGAAVEKLGSLVNVTVAEGGTFDLENTAQNLGDNNVVGLYTDHFELDSGSNTTIAISQPFNLSVYPQGGPLIESQSALIENNAIVKILFGSYVGDFLPGKGLQSNGTARFDLISAPNGQLDITGSEVAQINSSFATSIPFLFTGDVCTWNVNGNSTCNGANPGISELELDLTPKSAQTLGLTGYALKMFPYANESLVFDNNLGAAMLNDITNAQQAQDAYAAFAPDVSGASRALAISLTDDATNVVAARQRVLREYANQDGDLTLWTQEFVERLNQDNTVDGSGYSDSGFGFVLGADEGDPADGRYGGAFTFFSGGMSGKAPLIQKTQSEWYMATGYTDWHGRGFFLDTQASVGYAHLDGSRVLDLTGFTRTATDTRPAEYLAGGATAGLQYNVIGAAVMPQISLDGLAMRQEGYTERTAGAGLSQDQNGFDLHVEPSYAASARMFAGVDTRDDINVGDFLLQPEARAGYRYDFANGQESVTANFIDVTPTDQFKISGPKPSAGNALAGLGVSLATGAWSLGLSVDYLYASSGNTSEEGTVSLIGRI